VGEECWVLSAQGQACSELCGSEAATDLLRWNAAPPEHRYQVVQALSRSALPPAALDHHAATNVLHIDEACGSHGYGSQYLYIAQGYQWDCYRQQSFFQIDRLYRAPCLCKHQQVRRGLSYLQGALLGLLVLAAVWVLASCKWRLDEAGLTPPPMRLGRDLWPGFGPLLASLSLLDLASDVLVLLTLLRREQWGLVCTMALLLGVAWGVMLRTIASELPASRRSLTLREVGSPPGLGSYARSRAGSSASHNPTPTPYPLPLPLTPKP